MDCAVVAGEVATSDKRERIRCPIYGIRLAKLCWEDFETVIVNGVHYSGWLPAGRRAEGGAVGARPSPFSSRLRPISADR